MKLFLPIIIILLTLVIVPNRVQASTINGNNIAYFDNDYLITEGASEVNLNPTQATSPASLSTSGLIGEAWSAGTGWINFAPTNGGVSLSCDTETNTGTLSGYAWGEGAGWINFAPTNGGVSIDPDGFLDGEAWAESIGWLVFDKTQCPGGVGCVQFSPVCPTVITPPPTPPSTSGGGGGGGSSTRVPDTQPDTTKASTTSDSIETLLERIATLRTQIAELTNEPTQPSTPGEYNVCEPYLKETIRLGADNNPTEVNKLITFLNDKQGENLTLDGQYDQDDFEAVKRFQAKYPQAVLSIWGLTAPTGYVYTTTKLKINSFYCQQQVQCPAFTQFNSYTDNENTNSPEVQRTKGLLTDLGFYSGAINQTLDLPLHRALITFQEEFPATMLAPWGLTSGTGYKYKTTNKFLNFLVGCETPAVELDGRGMFDY